MKKPIFRKSHSGNSPLLPPAIFLFLMLFQIQFVQGQHSDLDLVLKKLDAGESVENMTIVLGDINFATGTANLEPLAKSYLDKVGALLEAAPNLNLSIEGHTDNTGTQQVNERLSTDRANAVMQYLTGRGIEAGRLEARGFGSSAPVADNSIPEGRAKNRRVEMDILRNAEAKTIQDIIILRNGTRLGATVQRYDENEVVYVQFSTSGERIVLTDRVERIIFADGREVVFQQKTPSPTPSRRSAPFRPFAESEAFHPGQFFVGLGYGIKSNIGIGYGNSQVAIPPCLLILEMPLGYNFGAGISAGGLTWNPLNDEDNDYGYYALSPRLAYHFNLGPKLDLFAGASLNFRMGSLQTVSPAGDSALLTNLKVDGSAFFGARYYLGRFFGFFAEWGGDNISCAKAGLSFRFGN